MKRSFVISMVRTAEAIRDYIGTFVQISDRDWEEISSCLSPFAAKANEVILSQTEVCKKVYFLTDGLLRYYQYIDGEEVTKYFTFPPYCFTSQRSLNLGIPAEENIAAITKSTGWQMSKTDAFDLFRLPCWSEFIRKLVQEVQYQTELILLDQKNKTAEERYRQILTDEGSLINEVPLKVLASYLGIKPQSLSRIRKRQVKSDANS